MKRNITNQSVPTRQKEPIHVRERQLRNGNVSLYLDIYQNGKRTYENLNLYLVKPLTAIDRRQNDQTLQLAQNIKAEKILELQKISNGVPVYKLDYSFIVFFKAMMKERYNSKGNYENWDSALQHIEIFTSDEDVTFRQITPEWLTRLKNYLMDCRALNTEKKLAPNSAYSYFNKVRAALRRAYEEEYIPYNPAQRVRGIKPAETNRENLTLEEVQKIALTPCDNAELKKAFLFSALTGLRWSDVTALTWAQIEHSELTGHFIRFNQKKTKGREFLPISQQARDVLGPSGIPNVVIFDRLKYSVTTNVQLGRWMRRAGILKHITFHCARHTHATLLLSQGVDIYVLSKMLGHKKVSTTEIYTKVLNNNKVEAANKIPMLDLSKLNV